MKLKANEIRLLVADLAETIRLDYPNQDFPESTYSKQEIRKYAARTADNVERIIELMKELVSQGETDDIQTGTVPKEDLP